MRAQFKVVALVAIALTLTLATVVWKTKNLIIEDKINSVNDSAMKQLAPLKRLVAERLETRKKDLIRFATARESGGPGHAGAYSGFDAIALVEANATNGQWSPTWIEKGPTFRSETWTEGYDLTLLKSLPYQKVKDGSTLWVRLSDAQGAPLYAVLNAVEVQMQTASRPAPFEDHLPDAAGHVGSTAPSPVVTTPGATRRAIIVGFATENPIAAVTEDFTGLTESVYLVDDRGYVASHVKTTYLGNSFSDDKMTQEIMRTPKLTDTHETIDIDGRQMLGHFERIEHTNLTAVILSPMTAVTDAARPFVQTVFSVGGLLSLLWIIAAFLLGGTLVTPTSSWRKPSAPRADDLAHWSENSAGDVNDPSIDPSIEQTPPRPSGNDLDSPATPGERLRLERKSVFEAFNSGFAMRLREPLLAILGHAQLAKAKSTDTDITAHAESIEREARLAKDTIERFQLIEDSADLAPVDEKCDLEKAVLSALADKAIEIEGSGITLEQRLVNVPRIRGRSTDVESMIGHILENSIEALRDRPFKKITIHLSWIKDHVRLLMSDSGIGMTRDVQARAYEPFFKGFEAPRHMGLGLAFVQTTAKRIGASHELESSPGEGTVFTFEFPVDAESRQQFEASSVAPGLEQINETIEAFTLGGRKPISGSIKAPTPPPLAAPNPELADVNPVKTDETDGFRVKIRRLKPRG